MILAKSGSGLKSNLIIFSDLDVYLAVYSKILKTIIENKVQKTFIDLQKQKQINFIQISLLKCYTFTPWLLSDKCIKNLVELISDNDNAQSPERKLKAPEL